MTNYLIPADRLTLSLLDVRLLIALLDGQNVGYDIARRSEKELGNRRIYTANAYKALFKLEKMMLVVNIGAVNSNDSRQKSVYKITSIGKSVLTHELYELKGLISIGEHKLESK